MLELAHLWKCDWCIGEIRWLGGDLVIRHGPACAARNPDGSWPPRWPLPRPAPMMTPAGITTPKPKAETRGARVGVRSGSDFGQQRRWVVTGGAAVGQSVAQDRDGFGLGDPGLGVPILDMSASAMVVSHQARRHSASACLRDCCAASSVRASRSRSPTLASGSGVAMRLLLPDMGEAGAAGVPHRLRCHSAQTVRYSIVSDETWMI